MSKTRNTLGDETDIELLAQTVRTPGDSGQQWGRYKNGTARSMRKERFVASKPTLPKIKFMRGDE